MIDDIRYIEEHLPLSERLEERGRDGSGGVMDPTEMRRRCHVWWSYVEPPGERR